MRRSLTLCLLLGLGCSSQQVDGLPEWAGASRRALTSRDDVPDLLLGQAGWSNASGNRVDGTGLDEPWGVAVDRSVVPARLWVADRYNHRVLGYRDAEAAMSTDGGLAKADYVVGAASPDDDTVTCLGTSATALCEPSGVAVDAQGALYVADTRNNRVLLFPTPTTSGTATRVFGQPSLTTSRCSTTVSEETLCSPRAVAVDDGRRLYVADQLNNRVLRFDTPLATSRATGVFGQAKFTTNTANYVDGAGVRSPFATAYDAARDVLFLADSGNSRVLVWTSAAAFSLGQPAARVIGQADMFETGCNKGGRTAATLCTPTGLFVDPAGHLYVADSGNNRVLIFDGASTNGDAVADLVIGQADFTQGDCAGVASASNLCLSTSALSLSTTSTPRVGIAVLGNRLALSDTGRHRVLIFDSARPPVGTAAATILGQAAATDDRPNRGTTASQVSMYQPAGLFFETADRLWVADRYNSRVLRYSLSLPTPAPTLVIGQSSYTVVTCRSGVVNGLCYPSDVSVFEGQLFVADSRANRVTAYSLAAPTNGMSMAFSLASTLGTSVATGRSPAGDAVLFLGEAARHRLARYQSATAIAAGATPVAYLGQRSTIEYRPDLLDGSGLSRPAGMALEGAGTAVRLWVADSNNHRVIRYPDALVAGSATAPAADVVLGQATFVTALCSSSSGGFCTPESVAVKAADRVIAADSSRAFLFNVSGASGTVAQQIGASFGGTVPDAGMGDPRAGQVRNIRDLAWSGSALFVADSRNHRVLRFDDPAASFPLAQQRWGQGTWGAVARNGASGSGLYLPTAIAVSPNVTPPRVWVADSANNRVLGWRSIDAQQSGQKADLVLGQPDEFTTDLLPASATAMRAAFGLAVDVQGNVYVADRWNHRVLIFNDPFTDATPTEADEVVGQRSLTGALRNAGGATSPSSLSEPMGLALDAQGRLYVADSTNNRVVVFAPPLNSASSATLVFGQQDFTSQLDVGDTPAEDSLRRPMGVAVDRLGNVYVADTASHRVVGYTAPFGTDTVGDVVLLQPSLQARTTGWCWGDESGFDGTGNCPISVVVDRDLNVFVTEGARTRLSLFENPLDPQGDQIADATFGGTNPTGCVVLWDRDQPNVASQQSLCLAWGLAVDPDNALWVTDAQNHRVLRYLDNAPPRALMPAISPTAPRRGRALLASYTYSDADLQPEGATRITWLVDGVPRASLANLRTVDGLELRKGERWSFEVEPFDGLQYGPRAAAPPVVVLNSAPAVVVAAQIDVLVGSEAVLDASATADIDGDAVTFAWTQSTGETLTLSDAAAAAPTVTPTTPGSYLFRVVAADADDASPATDVELRVLTHGADNQRPVANIAGPSSAAPGDLIPLDGSGSTDPDPFDGAYLRFRWELVGYPTTGAPLLVNGDTAQPVFTARAEGRYTVRLVVNDGSLDSEPSYFTVLVGRAPSGCGCTSTPGAGWLVALASLLLLRRRGGAARWPLALVLVVGLATPALAGFPLDAPVLAAAPRAKKKPKAKVKVKATPEAQANPEEAPVAAPAQPPPSPRAAPVVPQGPSNSYLDEAKALYADFQYEQVLPRLEFALAVKGVTDAQRVEIYKLMAFLHIALDDQASADRAFGKLLDVDPAYRLEGASPKVRTRFQSAYAGWEAARAITVDHTPPRGTGSSTTTVDVLVSRGQDRVAAVSLHYRLVTERPTAFSQTDLRRGDGGRAWSAPVPIVFDAPAGKRTVQYFMRVRGPAGELLAQLGEEAKPLTMEVETVVIEAPKPFYASPVLWVGVAVGALAAVAVPMAIANRPIPVQAGSLGKEALR